MRIINQSDIHQLKLPGRIIQKCVGKEAHSESTQMTMGFARYSLESGSMEPHRHAEEIVYVLQAVCARVRYGTDPVNLSENKKLEQGMTLHIPANEWHVFEYEEGGSLDAVFFYGQTEGIRPEEMR